MGLFDFLKKKTDQTTHAPTNKIDISKTLIQDVTLQMVSMRVISDPMMKFLYDDKGILDRLFHEHTTDKEFLAIKQQSEFNYLFVCGMHAFGAGIFVTAMQPKLEKAPSISMGTISLCLFVPFLLEFLLYYIFYIFAPKNNTLKMALLVVLSLVSDTKIEIFFVFSNSNPSF